MYRLQIGKPRYKKQSHCVFTCSSPELVTKEEEEEQSGSDMADTALAGSLF